MTQWQKETLFFIPLDFFESLIADLKNAKTSVTYESYIFEPGKLSTQIETALLDAQSRGVEVRLMADWFGSITKISALIPFRRFNPWLKWLNRRNHRKICVIDKKIAYLGGMNVSDAHLDWRDTGVRLEGGPISIFSDAFEIAWSPWWQPDRSTKTRRSALIRLNQSRAERKRLYIDLLKRIQTAQKRVWLTTAYFIPARSLVRVLKIAARRGVDVRILVPGRSDVFFSKWISYVFYKSLIDGNIKIFEYEKKILHAKNILIDNWCVVGTSNLNQRSLRSDFEADVVLTQETSRSALEKQFLLDTEDHSLEVTKESFEKKSRLKRWIGKLLLVIKRWN